MKVLLDEDVAAPYLEIIRYLLPTHQVDSVYSLGWGGKKDRMLYADAARKGYEVMVSANHTQLNDPDECKAIRDSRMHVVYFGQADGLDGFGRSAASLLGSIVEVIQRLEVAKSQQIVRIMLLRSGRFEMIDTRTNPPTYWP